MTGKLRSWGIGLAAAMCLWACATVSTPTGGPRDERPPVVLSNTTPSGTVNFDQKTIIVEFDEFVKLQNPSQLIYSSPPLGNSVDFVTRKNKLFVTFADTLAQNTTYHLNFGNSIQDVNEGNALNNFQIVFATGPEIDSLSLRGKLVPAGEATVTATTLIGLYKNLEDSAFLKEPPFYFTFAEKDGSFKLNYLKGGTYMLVALTDANNNYYYDLPNESIGFMDSALRLTGPVSGLEIPLFFPEDAGVRIKSYKNAVSEYQVTYELSNSLPAGKPVSVLLLRDSVSTPAVTSISEDRTKITAWIDTVTMRLTSFQSVVSVEGMLQDTIQHSVAQRKKPRVTATFRQQEMAATDTLILALNVPLGRHCENIAAIDSLSGDTISLNLAKRTDFQLVAIPESPFRENVVYTLLTGDSCVVTAFGQFAEIPRSTLQILSADYFGTLSLNFTGMQDSIDYLIELLDEKESRSGFTTISLADSTWRIKVLEPGTYSLQITEDGNRNGVWNSGSYRPKKFPEKLYVHSMKFTIRSNWEVEETVNLGAP